MKRSPDDIVALDIIIKDLEILKKQEERRRSASADLLDNIDRTTIIKMSNTRKYRVSPMMLEFYDYQKGDSLNGYAGIMGKTIDRFELTSE